MPKIRFANLPRPLWQQILDRVAKRSISLGDLQKLKIWVDTEPHAPAGDWYKDFGSFVLCGSDEYLKTVLKKGMKPFAAPFGHELHGQMPKSSDADPPPRGR